MTDLNCIYCLHPIDTDSDGWGYHIEGSVIYWHSECLQIFEEVRV